MVAGSGGHVLDGVGDLTQAEHADEEVILPGLSLFEPLENRSCLVAAEEIHHLLRVEQVHQACS